jgi:nudix-type nucleoside diphosphatase (YffH/AdpP family)
MDRSQIKEKSRTRVHGGRLPVDEIVLEVPRFSGGAMEVSREISMRPDAAAALVHDTDRDVFILCEQFRLPSYLAGGGWLLELPAGKVDEGETPEQCIRRELEEEVGYRAGKLEPITSYFPSPGYSAERLHLFYAPVTTKDLIAADAHGVDEGEDVQRFELPRAEFLDRLDKHDFEDGKVLALGAWAVRRFS